MWFSRYILLDMSLIRIHFRSFWFVNGLALNQAFAFRLVFIKWLLANGDGEIRTLDPLLARQVLSQLSYTPINNLAPTCSPMPFPA